MYFDCNVAVCEHSFLFLPDDCAGMFKCNNGRCIQNDLVCNGEDECKDLTDELNCGMLLEPRHEKTNVMHMQKQRRRSASR